MPHSSLVALMDTSVIKHTWSGGQYDRCGEKGRHKAAIKASRLFRSHGFRKCTFLVIILITLLCLSHFSDMNGSPQLPTRSTRWQQDCTYLLESLSVYQNQLSKHSTYSHHRMLTIRSYTSILTPFLPFSRDTMSIRNHHIFNHVNMEREKMSTTPSGRPRPFVLIVMDGWGINRRKRVMP